MPKVSDEHRAAMRERIQQSAIEVVRTKGLATLTMGDIITASGLSAGAIYGYYKGKDELVVDVARTVMTGRRDIIEEMTARSPVPPPGDMLAELLSSVPTDWLRGGLLMQFWALATTQPTMMEQVQEFADTMFGAVGVYLQAWLRQGGLSAAAARTRTAELVPIVTGLAQGYILQTSLRPDLTAEAYAAAARQVLDGALAAGHPHARD